MNKYERMCCPVCHAKFFEEDDIVICPECGAPHHKACYKSIGRCAHEDTHGTENQWQMPVFNAENDNFLFDPNNTTEITDNEEYDSISDKFKKLFSLDYEESDEQDDTEVLNDSAQKLIEQALNIDGVNLEDKIDGEKVTDVAFFVGAGITKYIRIFKELSHKKSIISWNWAAFLIPQYWLLSRKCYIAGAFTAILSMFSSIVINIMQYNNAYLFGALNKAVNNPSMYFTDPALITLMILFAFKLILHIIIGLLGNYIYKRHVFSGLKDAHEQNTDDPVSLVHRGGFNFLAPVIAYFLVSAFVTFLPTFI